MDQPTHIVSIRFTLNGKAVSVDVGAAETALHVIRERMGLKGSKEGCGIGECGACTIVVDGRAVNACLLPAPQLDEREVVTVEGLAAGRDLHRLQQALLDGHAVQCGFCTPGILMSAHALLLHDPAPAREDLVRALSGNLCRCTGYQQILDALQAVTPKGRQETTGVP